MPKLAEGKIKEYTKPEKKKEIIDSYKPYSLVDKADDISKMGIKEQVLFDPVEKTYTSIIHDQIVRQYKNGVVCVYDPNNKEEHIFDRGVEYLFNNGKVYRYSKSNILKKSKITSKHKTIAAVGTVGVGGFATGVAVGTYYLNKNNTGTNSTMKLNSTVATSVLRLAKSTDETLQHNMTKQLESETLQHNVTKAIGK